MEIEFRYISEKSWISTAWFLISSFVIVPVLCVVFYRLDLWMFPLALIVGIPIRLLNLHLYYLQGSFEANDEECTFTLSGKTLHFRYEEISGVETAVSPYWDKDDKLSYYELKLSITDKNYQKYYIRQKVDIDYALQKYPEHISYHIKQAELNQIKDFLKSRLNQTL